MKTLLALSVLLAAPAAASAASFQVLLDFNNTPGANPIARPAKAGTALCGTTLEGGQGYGVVYCVDRTSGQQTEPHIFLGGTDGGAPMGGVIDYKGRLYGTTSQGGSGGAGTVFSIDLKTGAFKTLYAFTNKADGGTPSAALIEVNGLLYGTAMTGGINNLGTVFSIDPRTGQEQTVFRFKSTNAAAQPFTSPIAVGNVLYGTADGGNFSQGGLLYRIDLATGKEKDLAVITEGPAAPPVYVNGALWGTTVIGGQAGYGAIYRVDPNTGAVTYVYSFDPFVTGAYPAGSITVRHGLFYTTASSGGANDDGTVMRFDPATGTGSVVYTFTGGADGSNPQDGLTEIGGRFYGTAFNGAGGFGSLFELRP